MFVDWKGFGCNMSVTPMESTDVSGTTEMADLSEKTEYYYRATMQYSKVANGINVVVYDTLTEKVADTFGIDADNGCLLVR